MKEALVLLVTNIANLIKVKTLVTLALIGALVYGFLMTFVPVEVFTAIVGSVITYYFVKKDTQ